MLQDLPGASEEVAPVGQRCSACHSYFAPAPELAFDAPAPATESDSFVAPQTCLGAPCWLEDSFPFEASRCSCSD